MILWIILGIVAVIVISIIALYNSLVKLRMRVKNAFAQIDTQLKRRFDLIPNLIEVVKKYAQYEQETLEKVVSARSDFTSSSSVEQKQEANNALTDSLKSIFALSEAYPDLKANQNFSELQVELSGTEDKIAYARQFYNDSVQMYNSSLQTFPSNILAGMFNFKEENFFEITDEAQKEVVKVEL